MKLFTTTRLICTALLLFLLAGVTAHAADGDLKLQAQLILCSNDPQPKGQTVAPEIEQKLKRLPLKWQHYYVVSAQSFSVAKNESKSEVLGKSEIAVKNLGGEKVELTLVGQGKITQSLRKGQTLVTNGNDENSIVVLRQMN
jgi:hypothetical protein